MQHRQPENAPAEYAKHGQQIHDSLRRAQLGLLCATAGLEDLVKSFDLPALRVPIELLDRLSL